MKQYLVQKAKLSYSHFIILGIFLLFQTSCKKYLDIKQNKKLSTPTTVHALQGFLDNYSYMNIVSSQAGDIASDNYYLSDATYLSLPNDRMRNAYLWQPGLFTGMSPDDWVYEYNIVYNANLVLDNIDNIQRNAANALEWDNCKGSAYLYRGKAFYEVAQIWALAYDSSTAGSDLGIPLRLNSDFNEKSVRSNIRDTYNQIISDLEVSIPLLPNNSLHPYRPSKPAAYGLLARTYLTVGDYGKAKLYADSCLNIHNNLLDFNTLDPTATYPFSSIEFSNPEHLMYSKCVLSNYDIHKNFSMIDSALYQSYSFNDLRKTIYFDSNSDGSHYFRGGYNGGSPTYSGIATDEIYLIRAESFARLGNVSAAMSDLNTLLSKRWVDGSFVPFTTSDASAALNIILTERRKELIHRGLRFTDIKRLNKRGANIIQKHIIQGQSYILPANDPRYALPIPDNVIQYTGMQQN